VKKGEQASKRKKAENQRSVRLRQLQRDAHKKTRREKGKN
jgi:hypothetical protein